MKNLIPLLLIVALFSCSGKQEKTSLNILENLTFTVDTVVVDSGEDFFSIGYGLGTVTLNKDKSKLLFFENEPLNLVEVDLNNLKLVRKILFQREGPNGVGPNWVRFQLGPVGELFIQGYKMQGIFNYSGELIESLKVVPEGIDSELANNFQELYASAVFDFEKNRIYSKPSSETLQKNELFIIDPLTKNVRIEPIPEMKAVKEFVGTFVIESDKGSLINFFWVDSDMYVDNGQLLITAGSMSGIYRLDLKTDSLEFIAIQQKAFPNRMTFDVNNSPADEATFIQDQRKIFEHLNYMEPRWDESRAMFLRLGRKTFLGEKRGDPFTYEVFLFAYDTDFNVLGETKIDGLDEVPSSYFWKDGKLYSFVNVDDELGFAVFTFNF